MRWEEDRAGQKTESGLGSGFVVDPSGLVMTNYHVIEAAEGRLSLDRHKKSDLRLQLRPGSYQDQCRQERLRRQELADKLPTVATFGSPLGGRLPPTAKSRQFAAAPNRSHDEARPNTTQELGYDSTRLTAPPRSR